MVTEDIRQRLQMVVAELQSSAQQVASVSGQIKELEGTLEHLSTQEEERAVYRQSGPLLLEVSDRGKLSEDIEKTITTLKEHEQRLVVQEETLRTQYDQMVKQFEGS